jgi:hypothetical protein
MAYADGSNPREVRAMLENCYAGYVRGEDMSLAEGCAPIMRSCHVDLSGLVHYWHMRGR